MRGHGQDKRRPLLVGDYFRGRLNQADHPHSIVGINPFFLRQVDARGNLESHLHGLLEALLLNLAAFLEFFLLDGFFFFLGSFRRLEVH